MRKVILLCLMCITSFNSNAINNFQFYRAQPFFGEPRLEKAWLGSADCTISTGSAHHTPDKISPLNGKFHITELTLSYIQNFTHGFFAGIFAPARFMHAASKISCQSAKIRGIGDTTLYAGWTKNYQETQRLDYIDGTFKLGLLLPTAKKTHNVFKIPLGYNKHTGLVFSAGGSLGAYDWITVGGQLETLLLIGDRSLWQLGLYARADHFVRGLSFLTGYSYTQQNHRWNMHTINLAAEYDFTKEYMKYGPRLGAFYDIPISGNNIFKTKMGGGCFGVDIAFSF